jgi:hypothetical protein
LAIFIVSTQDITICLNFSGDQIKDNDTGRAGTAYGVEKSVIQGFGGKNWEKQTTCKTYASMEDNINIDL